MRNELKQALLAALDEANKIPDSKAKFHIVGNIEMALLWTEEIN